MSVYSRRAILALSMSSMLAAAACGNGVGSDGASRIDQRVQSTLAFMDQNVPASRELQDVSVGMLVMPLVTEASFGFGGSFGRGALLVRDATVDYYSQAQGTFGLQIGAQQYAHVLFFMTEEALQEFRTSPGWSAGANVEYALNDQGENIGTDTNQVLSPVIGVVFGQAGLLAGASVEGTKYTRIIP